MGRGGLLEVDLAVGHGDRGCAASGVVAGPVTTEPSVILNFAP